jgi:predicted CoA-binding protein
MASTTASDGETDWRRNIVATAEEAQRIAAAARVVAVLGIKTERHAGQPAFDVPLVLQKDGVRIVPVPVYYPEVKEILGEPVVRDLREVAKHPAAAAQGGGAVCILDVFRRSQDVPAHVPDILAMDPRPACVWLQSGCGNAEAEEALAREGVVVVTDRCLKVDRLMGDGGGGGGKGGASRL